MNIFTFSCLLFMLGCFCGIKLPTFSILVFLSGCVFTFFVKILLFKFKKFENLYMILILVLFVIGATTGFLYDRHCFSDVKQLYGTEVSLQGTAIECDDYGFVVDTGDIAYKVYNYDENVKVYKYDTVKVSGVLEGYPVAQFRGDFDSKISNALKGVYGKMTAREIVVTGHDDSISVRRIGYNMRAFLDKRIKMFATDETYGLIKALLIGVGDDFVGEVREQFRLVGLAHLVAISGLHLSIFLSFFFVMTTKRRKNKIVDFLTTVFLVFIFALLVGERGSILRAGFMVVVSSVIKLSKRRIDSVSSLMIAGVLICILNPYYMADPGFQLSFFATFGIVLFAEHFKNQYVAVPIIATMFLLPLTLYYYNMLSLENVLVTILIIFLIPTIIALGYLSCIIPFLGVVPNVLVTFVLWVTEYFANISFLHITIASPDIYGFVFWVFLIFIAYFILDGFKIDEAFAALLCLLFFTAYAFNVTCVYEQNSSTLNFINIGKYNMEHIVTEGGKNIFVDCGYDTNSYITKYGIDDISFVFVTENTISKISGLEELCKNHTVDAVMLPQSMRGSDLQLENCRVLYYNQDDYNISIDNVKLKSTKRDGKRCVLLSVYEQSVAIPINTKSIADVGRYDIMCVPHGCVDIDEYIKEDNADYFVHATNNLKHYDDINKYVTFDTGMLTMKFRAKKAQPKIKTYS